MIRFPNIQALNVSKQEITLLYSSMYDIFLQNVNENIKNIFRDIQNVSHEKKIILINKPDDILNQPIKTKQQKMEEIKEELQTLTIYQYAGFEIIDESTSVFVNQFMEEKSLKQIIIQMIKKCRYLSGRQAEYIESINNMSDGEQEKLMQFKQNLQNYINKEDFDNFVNGIGHFVGEFLDKYFDGKNEVYGVKLPPLQGIQNDLLDLYNAPNTQDNLLHTLYGNKLMKIATNPYSKCAMNMSFRIFKNYKELRQEQEREEYIRMKRGKVRGGTRGRVQ